MLQSQLPRQLQGYQVLKKLGKGGFSTVLKCYHKGSNKVYAVKKIKSIDQFQCHQMMTREIAALSHLKHPNIIRLYDHVILSHEGFLILEYVEGVTLIDKFSLKFKLPFQLIASIAYKLCDALEYVHQNGFIHRDIKLENILLTSNDDLKLFDFGTADNFGPTTQRKTFLGTIDYLSPETLGKELQSDKTDLWAVGVLLYELATTQPLFKKQQQIEQYIVRLKQGEQLSFPTSVTDETLKDLIRKLLSFESVRLSAADVKRHPWVTAHYSPPPKVSIEDLVPVKQYKVTLNQTNRAFLNITAKIKLARLRTSQYSKYLEAEYEKWTADVTKLCDQQLLKDFE